MLDFLGIGAQKAGTTWLYEALRVHPDVRFPTGKEVHGGKEVHFWNAYRARGIDWYRAQFDEGPPGSKAGEITPAYAMLAPETVAEIRRLFPALRILYVIRNPIDRAWSSALMALERAEMTLAEASDAWFIDHFRSRGSLARGDYEACLRTWHHVFGREQLLALRYEKLCNDPLGFVCDCARHIGADPAYYERERPDILTHRVFSGPEIPIRDTLWPVLHDLYRTRIEALQDYLKTDLGGWTSA